MVFIICFVIKKRDVPQFQVTTVAAQQIKICVANGDYPRFEGYGFSYLLPDKKKGQMMSFRNMSDIFLWLIDSDVLDQILFKNVNEITFPRSTLAIYYSFIFNLSLLI